MKRLCKWPIYILLTVSFLFSSCQQDKGAENSNSTAQNISGNIPILEFDTDRAAVLEPQAGELAELEATKAVLCFFPEVLTKLEEEGILRPVTVRRGEYGERKTYVVAESEETILVAHPGVGGPLAAATLERLIANGIENVIAVGGAGVLDPAIGLGDLIIPTEAIRDEGTSYHYLAPDEKARASTELVSSIERVLSDDNVTYTLGMTWTIDAIYRETRGKVERRHKQGCLVVEMEAATFFAVAQFRGIKFGQILYGADDLSGEEWDHRDWRNLPELREKLCRYAVKALLEIG